MTPRLPVTSCRSCGRPMVWGRTHTGAPVPLDPDIVVIYDAEGVVRQGRVTHFASCPHAETHRRRTEADR